MKKVVSLLMTAVFLFALTGCSSKKIYEKEAKTFSASGMEIILTEGFKEADFEGYTACYDSSEVAIFTLKEEFSLAEGFEDLTLEEYSDLLYQANADYSPDPITEIEGIPCMEYTFLNEEEDVTFRYLTTLFKAPDAFWLIQFTCEEDCYEEYKPYFIDWAKTVTFE